MLIAPIINARSPEMVEELRAAVHSLREQGHEVDPRLTFEAGDARRFAREAAERGAALVVVAGGDGTINEVANGLHDHLERRRGEGSAGAGAPRLALVPLGTANDLANNLGIPHGIAEAMRVAVQGVPVDTNLGRVNGRCFLNVSTGGFGAEATGEAPVAAKRALGTLAYLIEGIRQFVGLELSRARFTADGEVYDGEFLLFAVGNARRTGAGTELTPRAEIADDLLDVCIVKGVSRVEFLGLIPELRAGEHLNHPAVIYRQVQRLVVEADVELHVNVDGEPMLERRFRYDVSPYTLPVMVPQQAAAELRT